MKRFIPLIILLSFFPPHRPALAQRPPAREQQQPTRPQPTAEKSVAPDAKPAAPTAAAAPAPQTEESEVSFDTLLGADAYLAYGEARNVGQQLTSGEVAGLIQSAQKMDLLPPEVQPVLAFVNSHAAELGGARLMFAAMRSAEDAKLPQILVALEFTSAPDAAKFETPLRQFLRAAAVLSSAGKKTARQSPSASFYLQRKSNVLLLSDERFELGNLKKAEGQSFAEDPNY
ncbi:MAG TPA: hypothetical protein VM870_10990, partial [Pyrinomonadaceae bacterium]|nr:hypothetical protein [Pyrinomonadaceae bacterium]